jgi:hypothetical protein
MRITAFVGIALALLTASPASAEIRLAISEGRVTLSARDATVRQILAEWARVGQTKIVNGERVPGGPVTLELTNVPEQQALEVLLRSASGYLAAPRAAAVANASLFDRILIMPTGSQPRAAASAAPATFPQPQQPPPFGQPQFPQSQVRPQFPIEDQDSDEPAPPVPPNAPGPNPRGGVFPTFPQPQVVPQPDPDGAPAQPNGPVSYPTPTAPVGVARPGMVVQPPPQPGQPGQLPPGVAPAPRPGP